ncbi:hypothetical protein HPP92_022924 [Vanilla planifolia]|uniref:Uncharacterized protein n=1 Tax=Vanilla planifolia TaxID=51239 RepID=A0A835PWL6_VANPL|nr:hypothetical protein HPP92_022924 [Vanilla planifolia]
MAGSVVIFDFDKTLIDCDSDNWVVDELGLTDLFDSLLPTMPWNTLMDRLMKELHTQGKTVDDIADVLKRAPLDTRTISAVRSAHAAGCDLRVVSDANLFFIETILKHHGLIGCFTEINTNPSYVDEEGRLKIFPYHDFSKSSHGCLFCPPNMCKSKIVERIQASPQATGKRIIYLGDGKGDYCPSLRLDHGDFMMPRKGYPCWELIVNQPGLVKAEVHEWSNWEEQERILLLLIRRPSVAGNAAAVALLSVDCKLEVLPAAVAHEAVLHSLPVPQ